MKNIERIDESHRVLWPAFKNYIKNKCNIDADEDAWDDVEAWWDCFLAGATQMYLDFKAGRIS